MTIKERVAEMVHKFAVQLSEEQAQAEEQAQVQFAAAMLDNGQEIQTTAEAFAEGVDVFVVNDQGEQIPLPDADYTLEDGTMFTVVEGVISAMGAAEAPVEESAQEEEMSAEEAPTVEEAVEAVLTREEVASMIAEAVEAATTQLSAQFAEEMAQKEAQIEKLSAQPAAKLARTKEVQKFSRQELASMPLKERIRALSI